MEKVTEVNEPMPVAKKNVMRRLYDWVVHWAGTRHAEKALAGISFCESSFFPIPPDVLLLAMGVSDSKRALRFAGICSVASVLGGIFGYFIGSFLWAWVDVYFFQYVPGFSPEKFSKIQTWYETYAFWIVFVAGFSPIPYKIFTVAAGVFAIHFPGFVLASAVSRSLRFFMIGGALYAFGPRIEAFIQKYFEWLALGFTLLGVAGFMAVKYLF